MPFFETVEMTKVENQSFVNLTIHQLKVLFGDVEGKGNRLSFATEFGTNGFCFSFFEEHIGFLEHLNSVLRPNHVFDFILIERWKVANDLINFFYSDLSEAEAPLQLNNIKNDALNLSAISTFPIIEEVARRISGFWSEDGIIIKDLPVDLVFESIKSNGEKETRKYKKDKNRIVDLSHKLILLEQSLHEGLQMLMQSLDKRLKVPFISGIDIEMTSMYSRLEYHRNMWLHGRKFDGIIGLFNSLLLALIYFGQTNDDE